MNCPGGNFCEEVPICTSTVCWYQDCAVKVLQKSMIVENSMWNKHWSAQFLAGAMVGHSGILRDVNGGKYGCRCHK